MRHTIITFEKRSILTIFAILPFMAITWSQAALSQEAKLTPVKIKKTNYEIEIPANWGKGAISGNSVLLSRSPGGRLYPNLNVTIQDQKNRSLTGAFDSWRKLLNNPETMQEQIVTINGVSAHFSALIWNSPLGGLKALSLFVEQGNKHLKITYVAKADNTTTADIELYMKSINTLRQIR